MSTDHDFFNPTSWEQLSFNYLPSALPVVPPFPSTKPKRSAVPVTVVVKTWNLIDVYEPSTWPSHGMNVALVMVDAHDQSSFVCGVVEVTAYFRTLHVGDVWIQDDERQAFWMQLPDSPIFDWSAL